MALAVMCGSNRRGWERHDSGQIGRVGCGVAEAFSWAENCKGENRGAMRGCPLSILLATVDGNGDVYRAFCTRLRSVLAPAWLAA